MDNVTPYIIGFMVGVIVGMLPLAVVVLMGIKAVHDRNRARRDFRERWVK